MNPITAVGLLASIDQLIDSIASAIKYLRAVKNAPKERANLAREMSHLSPLLTDLRYRVDEANSADPWFAAVRSLGAVGGPLDQFKDNVEKLERKLKPENGLNKISYALIWSFEKKEVNESLQFIERLKTLINLALQQDHL
jgi:hypothetical protein